LLIFLGKMEMPEYVACPPSTGSPLRMNVDSSVAEVRPVIVCGVLRGLTLDQLSLKRFMELQDKLHQNICRQRRLASIGTHDLSTVKAPFRYSAEKPEDIRFVPLEMSKEMNGRELMTHIENELPHLRPYVPLIKESPLYPVVRDANGVVMSLPPILNGDHSKITVNTRDVLVEVTALDRTKASIALNIVLTMFAEYSDTPFRVESVEVHQAAPAASASSALMVWPNFEKVAFETSIAYVNGVIGTTLDSAQMCCILERMGIPSSPLPAAAVSASTDTGDRIRVLAPCTRSDILHPCDIAEDVAIGYGYNKLVQEPPSTVSIASQQPLNKLTDQLRTSLACAGFQEILTFSLSAREDNVELFGNEDRVVQLATSKQFDVGRTCLLGGLLKTLRSNSKHSKPLRIFEVADVMLKQAGTETGAINRRRLCVGYYNDAANFEVVHGLLDRIMLWLDVPHHSAQPGGYRMRPSAHPLLFPGHQAEVVLGTESAPLVLGKIGVIHPDLIKQFKLSAPVTILEMDIEPFL
jgi:phenylalanyl-tRNA synthetase beta chain